MNCRISVTLEIVDAAWLSWACGSDGGTLHPPSHDGVRAAPFDRSLGGRDSEANIGLALRLYSCVLLLTYSQANCVL